MWKIRSCLIKVDYPQTMIANMVGESNHIWEEGKPAIKLRMSVNQLELVTISITENI